ncbi:MAG: D-alanyl-D-alanine carboxypeptidase/D-alanyl-D-alanine-endopeptidase [Pyrinomonadaceae bacterium]|nr:D-alanyl-D-alanine carboxypeptidase/D-alanyl-D-alanine-endopeptidase [Pyrinomonadaceae bacterium]
MNNTEHRRPLLPLILCATLLFALAFAVARPLLYSSAQTASQAREPKAVEEKRETDNKQRDASAKPTTTGPTTAASAIDTSPAALELVRKIDREIDAGEFSRARWGVFVMSLRDGRVLYARNADHPITPASNMKVYTTAVALDLLGADYRWRTSVYASAPPDASGTIAGDLVLYGRGAPDFSSEKTKDASASMAQLADALYRRGVRRVRGRIIGDESYFRGEPLGDGWLWNDVQWYFGAETSALSVNSNEVTVNIRPAGKADARTSIKLEPETDYVRIKDETNVVESGQPATLGITRGLSDNEVRVWGDFPVGGRSLSVRLSVHRPALWAATLFHRMLSERGITIEGETHVRDALSQAEKDGFAPERAVELASVTGKSLGEIARSTNKESINLSAELILRTLGKERGATVPDPKRMRERGDDEAGISVIRRWLEEAGIATGNLALHDGSGLSRLDLVTPEATARLLVAIARRPAYKVFRESLPIAGRDGTLKFRLRSAAASRILAKTGTLSYINSLSGYAITADDETLAFSIICNNDTAEARATRPIDAIATLLASYGEE